jgi:hypothetical protein
MRSAILSLQGLVDARTVLVMHGATREDMELLSEAEDEIKRMSAEEAG